MRGEYQPLPLPARPAAELPPRARRIRLQRAHDLRQLGTTSACAENTRSHHPGSYRRWNYLRVRGEYPNANGVENPHLELPPRARRIHFLKKNIGGGGGTTSACAENTPHHTAPNPAHRNYLRVRGEYRPSNSHSIKSMELPPRARRILIIGFINRSRGGTTSACAENTHRAAYHQENRRNYLRVRGEYPK